MNEKQCEAIPCIGCILPRRGQRGPMSLKCRKQRNLVKYPRPGHKGQVRVKCIHAVFCDSVVKHTISQNSGNPCAKLMILQSAVIKVVQIRLNEPSDVPNAACEERSLWLLRGNRAAYSGVKKCFWLTRGTFFRKVRLSSVLSE